MYLKSIELTGFKSFGKKISLEFGSRIAAIVGPNGSGKCVSPETLIQLADGRRIRIQELFDEANISSTRVRQYDDGIAVFASDETPEIVSMDVGTGKLVNRPVAAFIRRTAPDEMLTITTRSGKVLTTTPYHPLFTLKGGKITPLRADELAPGIRIAAPRRIAVSPRPYRFSMRSVLASFAHEDNVFLPYSVDMVRTAVGEGTRSAARLARANQVSSDSIQSWFDGQSIAAETAMQLFAQSDEAALFPDRTLKSKTRGTMQVPELLDERMARFLGYLIAEGRNCKNGQIRFVNDDMPLVEDFVECARVSFAVTTTVRSYKGRGIQDAFISSTTLSRFLDRVLGITQDGHSRDKSVPHQLFSSPNAIIAAFLAALFEGDAYIHCSTPHSRGAYVEYATASERLARDVTALLLRLGVTAHITSKQKRATNSPHPIVRTYWSVFVSGSENLEVLAGALTFRGRKKESLSRIFRTEAAANPNTDLIPEVCDLVRTAAQHAGVSIKKARKEFPTLAAYYEKRCEASRPGLIRCIAGIEKYGAHVEAAREQMQRLRELAETDVLWDEVVLVEKKKGEGFVYDLTVLDHHNFVAGEMIAHNSNVADGFRFVLGEQSMKSMRGKRGEDMIWGGSPALPRMNRAAVKLVFDNSKRLLDIDFSEVILERVVHRDGQNEYVLNGSQVRLKDVIRLLAGANIGGSGYQIISQGEADRILNASPRERREMVEDALGLKLYQHKKAESERKLEETAVNIDRTKSLRRELAPHLKFLQVQVEKIEKAREMKEELSELLREYLARENAWITAEHTRLTDEIEEVAGIIRDLEVKLREIQKAKGHKDDGAREKALRELEDLQHKLSDARRKREDIVRELGRAEGALEATNVTVETIVPAPHVREFVREVEETLERAEAQDDIAGVRALLSQVRTKIKAFIDGLTGMAPITNKEAEDAVARLATNLKKAEEEETRLAGATEKVRSEMTRVREASFAAEKEEVEFEAKLRETQSKLISLKAEKEHVALEKRRYEEEVREGVALLGSVMQGWDGAEVPMGALSEDRSEQEKRRRAVERLKIKIEEAGVGGGDAVMREYKQTQDRDLFLAKELEDLEKSSAALQDIIAELEETIDERFKDGLKHINEALGGFFAKLFGGGHAKLFVEEPRRVRRARGEEVDEIDEVPEEEELYAGLSIDVSLPRKKIRGLEVLSGGERALTSIALIFSMSQVNPPPFLILDETDAALDEANSKRYADMIQELGKKSQLIVITHNRATMSAAGELYGVTMGQDGVSKVLSVKLEEAERVAK